MTIDQQTNITTENALKTFAKVYQYTSTDL